MSKQAIEALRSEVERAQQLFASLSPEEWAAPSGCTGWSVQDVATHMAVLFQQLAAPETVDVGDSGEAEAAAEVVVQARRDWTSDQVIAAYDEWSPKGVEALAALQEPPMADTIVPISDLGEHPLHLLGNAIAFDHYCHLRHDIGTAIERAERLPRDEAVLAATLDWMLAGLPQMCASQLAEAPPQPVNLVIDGPAANSWCLTPREAGSSAGWLVANGADDDAPVVRTTAHDFVSWGTKRTDWRGSSTGNVDNANVAVVLDAINVI